MAPLKEMLACTMGLATSLAPQNPLAGDMTPGSSMDMMMSSTPNAMIPGSSEMKMMPDAVDTMARTLVPTNRRSIGVSAWGCGRLDTFAIGMDDAVWHIHEQDGTVSGWESLGGKLSGPPTVISAGKGHQEFFVRGQDHGLWTREEVNGKFGDWQNLGGKQGPNFGAATWGPGHAVVCALGGTDYDTGYCRQKFGGKWEAWVKVDGLFVSELSVIAPKPGLIYVYGIGLNGAVYQKYYTNGAWASSWASLGGNFESPPTAVSWGYPRIDIVGIDKDKGPVHRFYNGQAWSEWNSLGGKIYTAISATASRWFNERRIDILGLGGANGVYHKTYNGVTNTWTNWYLHGTAAYIEPMVTGGDDGKLYFVSLGKDKDNVIGQTWNGTSWVPAEKDFKSWGGQLKKFL